jgi:serine/threonine protein kinase
MPWEPEEGSVVADRYRLAEFLGKGGISRVWRGVDEETDSEVAIKHPNYDSSNPPEIVDESIRSELDVLETIAEAGGHPNVMELVDSVVHGDMLFIVVDFVRGEDMQDAVSRRGGITNPADIRAVGVALCEAMSFLHENDIVYRDLKPDNIFLLDIPDGSIFVKVLDFGIAKVLIYALCRSNNLWIMPRPSNKLRRIAPLAHELCLFARDRKALTYNRRRFARTFIRTGNNDINGNVIKARC